MGEYVAWSRVFAAELTAVGLRVNPDPPHMNTFEVFADSSLPELRGRLATLMERERGAGDLQDRGVLLRVGARVRPCPGGRLVRRDRGAGPLSVT